MYQRLFTVAPRGAYAVLGPAGMDALVGVGNNEIVNSDTERQPSGAALPCEGELSRLRSGGTPASLLSSRHLSCRSIRRPGLLDERAEDMPH